MNDQLRNEPDDLPVLEIEDALKRVRPDLQLIDRNLVLGDLEIELVTVDGGGRLVLVLLADDDPTRTVVRALDALCLDRARLEVLEDHLRPGGAARLDVSCAPNVVVLAGSIDLVLRARLEQLDAERVELMELCEVRSQRATTTHWVASHTADDAKDASTGLTAFVSAMSEGVQELVHALAGRIARLDSGVSCRVIGTRVRWRFRGDDLAQIEQRGAGVEVLVHGGQSQALATEDDIDSILGAAIGRYFHLSEERTGDDPELEQVELIPRASGVVLSREEIEAFRD